MSQSSQPEILNFCLQKKSKNLECQKQQLPTMLDSFSKLTLNTPALVT